jgi:hypothetical protein
MVIYRGNLLSAQFASEGCAEMGVGARRAARGDQKDWFVGFLSVYTYETRATRVCTYAGKRRDNQICT